MNIAYIKTIGFAKGNLIPHSGKMGEAHFLSKQVLKWQLKELKI
jgi:hypothetical protein